MAWPTKTDFVDGDVLTAAQVNNIGTNLNLFDPTSAANGQVWVANGSGSGSYNTVSAMTLLQSINLTSGTRHTVSSIPGTYQTLYCRLANCTISTATQVGIEINGLTNFYMFGRRHRTPTLVTADAYDSTYIASSYTMFPIGLFNSDTAASNTRGQGHCWINDYARASTKFKLMYSQFVGRTSGTDTSVSEILGFNNNTSADSAITSVAIFANGATFTGGTFEVYGVR